MNRTTLKRCSLSFLYLLLSVLAFSQQLEQVINYGGNDADVGTHLVKDASGNIYMAGYFENELSVGTTNLTSNGLMDAFLIKKDATNNVIWAIHLGTTNNDYVNAIKVDKTGTVYVLTSEQPEHPSYLSSSIYKISSEGLVVQTYADKIYQSIQVNDDNSVIFGYAETYTFQISSGTLQNDGIFGTDTYTAGGTLIHTAAFKFKPNFGLSTGNIHWFHDYYQDDSGNHYVFYTFRYNSSEHYNTVGMRFDSNLNLLYTTIPPTSTQTGTEGVKAIVDNKGEVFISNNAGNLTKYNSSLNKMWEVALNDINDVYVTESEVYIVGDLNKPYVEFPDTAINKYNGADIYMAKLDLDGYFLDAFQFGGVGSENGNAILLENGTIHIAGNFNGNLYTSTDYSSYIESNAIDVFEATFTNAFGYKRKYSNSPIEKYGMIWARRYGDHQNDYFTHIAYDHNGNIIASGHFYNEITFGSDTLISNKSNSNFLVKLDTTGTVIWSTVIDNSNPYGYDYDSYTANSSTYKIHNTWLSVDNNGYIHYFAGGVYYKYASSGSLVLTNNNQSYNGFFANSSGDYYLSYQEELYNTEYNYGRKSWIIEKYNASNQLQWTADTSAVYFSETGYFEITPYLLKEGPKGNLYVAYCNNSEYNNNYSQSSHFKKIDSQGNTVYVKNDIFGIQDFDFDTDGNIYFSILNKNDQVLVRKNSAAFGELWKKNLGEYAEYFTQISVHDNSVLVSANFDKSYISMDNELSATNAQGEQITLLEYDLSGNPTNIRTLGSFNTENVKRFTIDDNGNIYLAGYFKDDLKFGFNALKSGGLNADALLIKLNKNLSGPYDFNLGKDLAGGTPTLFKQSSNIVSGEYFFNSDPGVGNGTPITIPSADSAVWDLNIPVSSLSPGFHHLVIRLKDDLNKWSIFEQRSFYIQEPVSTESLTNQLAEGEYFFDNDPGIGNGTSFSISKTEGMNEVMNFSTLNLSAGFHQLSVRFKDDLGKWSNAESRTFYMISPTIKTEATNIVEAEYFMGNDPGVGNGTKLSITPSPSINESIQPNVSGFPLGNYSLSLRVKDNLGNWSIAQSQSFSIVDCTIPSIAATPKGETTVFKGNSTTYSTLGATDAASYEWKVIPSDAGSFSSSSTEVEIHWNEAFTGEAYLVVRGINSCAYGTWSDSLNIKVETALATSSIKENSFKVYPNPFTDLVTVHSDFNMRSLSVFNINGTKMMELNNLDQNTVHLNLSNYISGFYMLRITDATNTNYYFKVLKE